LCYFGVSAKTDKIAQMMSISNYFKKIEDKRRKQGRRYELRSIICLVLLGYMAGCSSLARVYKLGKSLNKKTRHRLGFRGSTPSHPTITKTMKMIDPGEFEELLGRIMKEVTDNNFKQIAIDGKSIRSTSSRPEGLLHLVSAFAPEVKAVLMQSRSEVAGGETKSAEAMIPKLELEGKIVTADALYAQEVLCHKIVQAGGDYVFKVKRNKKRIIADIEEGLNFSYNRNLSVGTYEYTTKGHGRIDHRRIEVIASSRKYFGGWGMDTIKQVGRIVRKRLNLKTGKEREDISYVISSLCLEQSNAEDLLRYSVNHWSIENILHRTRDTVFKEDVNNILCLKAQQINASLRNLAIYLLFKVDSSITSAIEKIRASLPLAFNLIFLELNDPE